MQLIPKGRIWIDTEKGSFLGYGRIELLEKIKETGSLRKAATEMKMSYQQAWTFVKQMNESVSEPLVVMQRGGKNGGTSFLSETGLMAVETFKKFDEAFQLFIQSQNIQL